MAFDVFEVALFGAVVGSCWLCVAHDGSRFLEAVLVTSGWFLVSLPLCLGWIP